MKNKTFQSINRTPWPLWKWLFYLGVGLGGLIFVRAVFGIIEKLI
jgi:hypothetical protein